MTERTALYEAHLAAGARMVDFGGWEMPLHYGSQIDEHHAVRRGAGVFDVSHMTVIDVTGNDAEPWLRYLLANDVGSMPPGRGLYSCMLNRDGGVVDDLIAYRPEPVAGIDTKFRVVVNAATRAADVAWMREQLGEFNAEFQVRDDLAMLALQGPAARERAAAVLPGSLAAAAAALGRFGCIADTEWFVARTGYTGEDGWEIMLPNEQAPDTWRRLIAAELRPCGLGARDTLRLEAGLNLYGQDMTASATPLESNLGWTVAWEPADRDFVGRGALERQRADGIRSQLTGLVLEDRGVMRTGQAVTTELGTGVVTSGSFSPTLGRSVALARLPAGAAGRCEVDIRGRLVAARIVRPPFVRDGKALIDCGDTK